MAGSLTFHIFNLTLFDNTSFDRCVLYSCVSLCIPLKIVLNMCRPYRSRETIFAIIKQQKSNQFQNANYIDVSFGIQYTFMYESDIFVCNVSYLLIKSK